MKSILQDEKECYICHTTQGLHEHHIFFGNANRRQSEKYGFKVYLCGKHHNLSNESVHFDKELDSFFKRLCQLKFEETQSRDEFMQIIGRNYLDD